MLRQRYPFHIAHKLYVCRTFRRSPGRLLDVLHTVNLRLLPEGFNCQVLGGEIILSLGSTLKEIFWWVITFSQGVLLSLHNTNSVHVWALLQKGQISMKFMIDTDHHFSECFQFLTRFAVDLNTNNKHSWRNCSWKFLSPARLFIVRNSLLL